MDEHKLKSVPMFASLGKGDVRRLAHVTDEIDVPEGKELLHEGQFAYEFMVILAGEAEVTRNGEHVADLRAGDVLGEMASLQDGKRNATVIARSPMSIAVMTAHEMRQLASAIPAFGDELRRIADERHPVAQCA